MSGPQQSWCYLLPSPPQPAPPQPQFPPPSPPPSILYTSPDGTVALIDIPTSISSTAPLNLLSVAPPTTPYILPEPKDPTVIFNQELQDLHHLCRGNIIHALNTAHRDHPGPWHLPRHKSDLKSTTTAFSSLTQAFKSNLHLLQPTSQEPLNVTDLGQDEALEITDIYNCIVQNPSASYTHLPIAVSNESSHPKNRSTFLIPPHSAFLLSPFQTSLPTFTTYAQRIGLFNFILLDPPWPNRSAERSRLTTYDVLPNPQDLLRIPIETSLRENALVAVWVTNKPRWRAFVLKELFPQWGVEPAGEWRWLKITDKGEPIFDLDSVMRKPYESLLFGRKKARRKLVPKGYKRRRGNGGEQFDAREREERGVPGKVILGVPDLHSRKPCLRGEEYPHPCPIEISGEGGQIEVRAHIRLRLEVADLVRPLLPADYTACEIFGRCLVEGWLTWGDDAIRYNAPEYCGDG